MPHNSNAPYTPLVIGQKIYDKDNLNNDNFLLYTVVDPTDLTITDALGRSGIIGTGFRRARFDHFDLSGVKLTNCIIDYASFHTTNLTNANLDNTQSYGVSFVYANLTDANFTSSNLTWSDLSWADLTNTDFTGSDLTSANFWQHAIFSNTILNQTTLMGTKFQSGGTGPVGGIFSVIAANLAGSGSTSLPPGTHIRVAPHLNGLNVPGEVIVGPHVVLKNLNLSSLPISQPIALNNADFTDSNLTSVSFPTINLENANFTNANLTNATFVNCNLSGVILIGAQNIPTGNWTWPPVIDLLGPSPQTPMEIALDGVYQEYGALSQVTYPPSMPYFGVTIPTPAIIISSNVDTSVLGTYTVIYGGIEVPNTNIWGNVMPLTMWAAQVTRTVIVGGSPDTTAPDILVGGANPLTLAVGTPYNEQGALAFDNIDGDITGNIIIDASNVNITVPGSYTVTYNVSDAAGNAALEANRTVIVVDTTPPVITLSGNSTVIVEAGTPYIEQGATVYDNIVGLLDSQIVIDNSNVDTSIIDFYTVTYNIADAAGNAAISVTRTVEVKDTQPPTITLNGNPSITIAQGTPYNDAGAVATDIFEGVIPVEIGYGSFNPVSPIEGVYFIEYFAMDSSENESLPVTRQVQVINYNAAAVDLINNVLPNWAATMINNSRQTMKTTTNTTDRQNAFRNICIRMKGASMSTTEKQTIMHEIVREGITNGVEINSRFLASAMGYINWPLIPNMRGVLADGFYELGAGVYAPLEVNQFVKLYDDDDIIPTNRHHYYIQKSSPTQSVTFYFLEQNKAPIAQWQNTNGPPTSFYPPSSFLGANSDDSRRSISNDKILLYGGVGAGGNPPPGSGGDPYIQPLTGPMYKLPDTSGNYRYLSTKEDTNNRFLVDMSVEKLTHTEQKELLGQMIKCNYTQLQKNKMTIDGYYYRNFYISNKHNYLKINLEDQTVTTKTSKCTLGYILNKGGEATYKNFEIKVIKHKGLVCKNIAIYNQEPVIFEVIINTHNDVYGNVEIVLSSFYNKQLRNGIKIKTQNPITINNSVGALLIAQPINNIMVSKLGSKKQLKDIKPFDATNFNMLTETHFTGMNSTSKVMLKQH